MTTKNKWLRVRLDGEEDAILDEWAEAYGEDRSAFIRRLLRSLPKKPPRIPKPEVNL